MSFLLAFEPVTVFLVFIIAFMGPLSAFDYFVNMFIRVGCFRLFQPECAIIVE